MEPIYVDSLVVYAHANNFLPKTLNDYHYLKSHRKPYLLAINHSSQTYFN